MVSKSTASFDYEDKPAIYRQAQVQEYIILDPLKEPWRLLGRRLHPQTEHYREIQPDKKGRIHSETLGLTFTIAPDGARLILADVATGEELRSLGAAEAAREAAELRAAQEVEARQAAEAENRRLAAEIERMRARFRDQ